MSFFSSEVVRAEMTEIAELQEQIYGNIFKFPTMSKDEKIEHVEVLERLLDKQKIVESAIMMGMPPGTDMNIILNNMSRMLDVMKEQIDKTGSDL
jgi:hypothetical protein